jgi:hypothetical protein
VVAGLSGSAGGITSLVPYPRLLGAGFSPLSASIANNVALVACLPGSAPASRPDLHGRSRWLARWAIVAVAGGAAGSVLLLLTPSAVCDRRGALSRGRWISRAPTLNAMRLPRLRRSRAAREAAVLVADPRLENWEWVADFEDQRTALAWRDQLRAMGVDATLAADHPLDRFGRGDISLVVPPGQWSAASEIIDNLE